MVSKTSLLNKERRAAPRRNWTWTAWVSYAAALWSLAYGALGLHWMQNGGGFPFGSANDESAALSLFGAARAESGAPIIAGVGLLGAIAALAMAQTRRAQRLGVIQVALLTFAWLVAATLMLAIPDYRVLMAVAYAPVFVLGAPFGWPPVSFLEAIPWPVINQGLCIAGGLLWAGTAVVYVRHIRGACELCGRGDQQAGWTTPASAARWGRWAVGIAVIAPVLYAITRWAWALGIPLGISEAFLREGQATGTWWAGAALATLAVGGAALTLGLVQRWGEVFPGWMPFVGSRRVPIALAVVPATLVAVFVTSAGLMFIRLTLTGTFSLLFGEGSPVLASENWATLAPELLWPLWGAALGAAALAYLYRRRGPCARCGRGG